MDHGGMPNMTMPMSPPGSGSMPMSMIMQMSFFWGKDVVILFKDWPNGNLGMYILALAFVFIIAATFEALAMLTTPVRRGLNPSSAGLILASVYAVRMALAYMVMLSVMSYNLGVFLVAVAGHALGFFAVKSRAIAHANANAHADAHAAMKV